MALTSQDKVRAVTGGQFTGWGGREPQCKVPEVTGNLAVLQDLAIFGRRLLSVCPGQSSTRERAVYMHVETRDILNVHHFGKVITYNNGYLFSLTRLRYGSTTW